MTWTKRSKYIFLQFLRSLNSSTVFMGLAWLCYVPKRGKMSWLIAETSVPLISHLCYLWTNITSTHWRRSHTRYFSLTFAHRWRVMTRRSLFVFFSGSLLFIRAPVRKLPLCFEILQEGDVISTELQWGIKDTDETSKCCDTFFFLRVSRRSDVPASFADPSTNTMFWRAVLFFLFPHTKKEVGTQVLRKCLHDLTVASAFSNYHPFTKWLHDIHLFIR